MNRVAWLDTSRGIAFLMVIYYHLSTCDSGGIVPFFTPVFLTVFFFVSGYLSKSNQSFLSVLEQRTRTIFIPFLFFGLLGGLLKNLCSDQSHGIQNALFESVKGCFYQYGEYQTLWFLVSLYIFSLIFYWIDRFCKNNTILLIVCSCLIVIGQLLLYVLKIPSLPYKFHTVFFACALMGLGKVYKAYEERIDKLLFKKYIIVILLLSYIILVFVFKPYINYYGNRNWLLAFYIPFSGLIVFLYFSKKISKNEFLRYIGSNSLLYFAIHRQVLIVVESICKRIMALTNSSPSVYINIIEVFVIAILIALPVFFINKYCPQIFGKGWKIKLTN